MADEDPVSGAAATGGVLEDNPVSVKDSQEETSLSVPRPDIAPTVRALVQRSGAKNELCKK